MGLIVTPQPQPRPHRYRLYIDESGDHDYNLLEDPGRRYLALLGVWFKQNPDYVNFADELEALKRVVFGPRPDKPVVLHRSDIINRKGAFGVLNDDELRRKFDTGLRELVAQSSYRIVCVVIDKLGHQRQYTNPYHPYHYCLAAMLDRYCGWLIYKNAVGDVLAESRGRAEDMQLKEAFSHVYESAKFSMFHPGWHKRALTSKDIKVQCKSANTAGLQLADMLAHPVKQAMLAEAGLVENVQGVYGADLVKAVEHQFNRNEATRVVAGYGKVWLSK